MSASASITDACSSRLDADASMWWLRADVAPVYGEYRRALLASCRWSYRDYSPSVLSAGI